MSDPYKWVGPTDKFEVAGSPKFVDTRDRRTWTVNYRGPFDTLKSNAPKFGDSVAGIDNAKVEHVECSNEGTNEGSLVITLGEFIDNIPPKYSVTREEVQKRLECHPRYIAAAGKPGTFYACTLEMMYWLTQALNDEKAAAPADKFPDGTADPFWSDFKAIYKTTPASTWSSDGKTFKPSYYLALVLGQPSLTELWDKIKEGEDSYMIGIPVVTEEKRLKDRPTADPIYVQEAPPVDSKYPSGYCWMRTKFDVEEDGVLFIQRKCWIGFDLIDTDIYS